MHSSSFASFYCDPFADLGSSLALIIGCYGVVFAFAFYIIAEFIGLVSYEAGNFLRVLYLLMMLTVYLCKNILNSMISRYDGYLLCSDNRNCHLRSSLYHIFLLFSQWISSIFILSLDVFPSVQVKTKPILLLTLFLMYFINLVNSVFLVRVDGAIFESVNVGCFTDIHFSFGPL